MLRVTVELVPFGIESKKRTLSKIEIINRKTRRIPYSCDFDNGDIVSSVIELSDYGVRVDGTDHGILVKGFDRSQRAHKLIKKVCEALEEKGILK